MNYEKEFMDLITPLLKDKKVRQMDAFIQHGTTTCLEHTISVAYKSYCIAKKHNINCDLNSLIRGAVLHDYFLYDWHDPDPTHKWHGFHHAGKALENASRDFDLTVIEQDIIVKHRFPLNITPPKYIESYIVTIADKICSTQETLSGSKKCLGYYILNEI